MDVKDSDSDVSDGWSLVDAAAHSESGSVKDASDDNESVSCNASDGESLEIIQEENDERKEFIESVYDVENDCFSLISDCGGMMMAEAVSEGDELGTSKLKSQTYVHRRNYLLNARLNFIMVVAVAAVAGLGVGHFIGSQEDCPLLLKTVPDTSVGSTDNIVQKDSKLDLSSSYFHQPLIKHMLKAKKNLQQIQHSYNRLEDGIGNQEKVFIERECLFDREPKDYNFQNGNQNVDTDVKIRESKNGKDRNDSDFANKSELEEREDVSENSANGIGSKVKTQQEDSLHQYNEERVKNDATEWEPTVTRNVAVDVISSDDTGIKQSKNLDHDTSDGENAEISKLKLILSGKNLNDHSKNIFDLGSEDKIVIQDRVVLQKESVHKKLKRSLYGDQQKVVDLNHVNEVPLKGELDDSFVTIDSDYEMSVVGNDKEMAVHYSYVSDGQKEGMRQENLLRGGDDDYTVHDGKVPSEYANHIPEQFPWFKEFSDTILHLNRQGDGNVFSVVDLLTSLKQSIIELNQTIITNHSSKFLKKMKVSLSKMKETMERIHKDVSSWSVKTTERIHHRLFKLKLKVQEKWCEAKDQHQQHHDANFFSWLKNNLFQDCKKDEIIHKASRGTVVVDDDSNLKKSHQHTGGSSDRKSNANGFDCRGDSCNKARPEGEEVSTHDFKVPSNGMSPESYGYARNAPYSEFHEFRKSSKGAFDKLRHHSAKCPPNCKQEQTARGPEDNWALAKKVAADWKDSSNASGIWLLRMAQGRAESRRDGRKSDWLFERARARKLRRDTDHERASWYFDRVQEREKCRSSPRSDWCLAARRSVGDRNKYGYDHFDGDDEDDEDEDDDDDKQYEYVRPKFWLRKIPSAPFAKTGKWLKNTVKEFKQKMNYYQYNQHKFHYV